jgi:hypothetical protein
MDGTLMLQAEQLMCGPLSKLWDICLGLSSSTLCTLCFWIEIVPLELIIGLVSGLIAGMCPGNCCPCLGTVFYYICPVCGFFPTCICCSSLSFVLLRCIPCLTCAPGITYECVGPILGKFEVCLWPYITRITSYLNRFTCCCL